MAPYYMLQGGEDQKYFALGTSKAVPAPRYEADSRKSLEELLAERERRSQGWSD